MLGIGEGQRGEPSGRPSIFSPGDKKFHLFYVRFHVAFYLTEGDGPRRCGSSGGLGCESYKALGRTTSWQRRGGILPTSSPTLLRGTQVGLP